MTLNECKTANRVFLVGSTLILAAYLLGTLLYLPAAQAQEKQRPQEESCTDGYYTGPRAGRKNYSHDKYIWVVTPAFAKRFCMPPEFVDEALKGAEAIAFRMSTSEGFGRPCTVIDGKEDCPGEEELRFDIFLRSDLNLPAVHPEVKFYDGSQNDAGGHISVNEWRTRLKRYKSGEYQPQLGTIPRFSVMNPFRQTDEDYVFGLARVHQGKHVWSITGLSEWSYRANWTTNLDLLILQGGRGGGFDGPRPQESGMRYAIVMGKLDAYVSGAIQNFSHTIWLPEKFYEKVHAAAKARGKNWADQLRMLRQQ